MKYPEFIDRIRTDYGDEEVIRAAGQLLKGAIVFENRLEELGRGVAFDPLLAVVSTRQTNSLQRKYRLAIADGRPERDFFVMEPAIAGRTHHNPDLITVTAQVGYTKDPIDGTFTVVYAEDGSRPPTALPASLYVARNAVQEVVATLPPDLCAALQPQEQLARL